MVIDPRFTSPRVSHRKARAAKCTRTSRSSWLIGPSPASSSANSLRSTAAAGLRQLAQVDRPPQVRARKIRLRGKAKVNQPVKEISGASGKVMAYIRAKARLGGVPMRVAIPPIEAA